MLAKELFERCDKETENILKAYLFIMFNHSVSSEQLEFNLQLTTCYPTSYLYHLITTTSLLNPTFEELLNKYNILKKLSIDKNLENDAKEEWELLQKWERVPSLYEFCFNYCLHVKSLIYGGVDLSKSTISLERILYNLLRNGEANEISKKFTDKEFLSDLENLALEKEGVVSKGSSTFNKGKKGKGKSAYHGIGEILTDKTYDYDPLIGRSKEFRKFCANIMDREKSVIVYGLPGVGKTTLAKGLAYRIQKDDVPIGLKDKRIIKVSGSEMIKGDKYVGEVEESLEKLINEVKKDGNNILFIDEIHTLMGLGAGSKSNNDVSNILKPALGDGEIKIIGATTPKEYELIKADGAFSRRFIPVEVGELSDEEILYILDKTVNRFKEVEGVDFSFDKNIKDQLLRIVLEISKEKYQDSDIRYNPDAALTLIRSGCNYCKLDGKKDLTIGYMIEGIESSSLINSSGIEYFKEKTNPFRKKKF